MLSFRSLHEILEALKGQESDLPSIVRTYLARIEERKNLNAFVEVFEDEALEMAGHVQDKISLGTAGKLAGMVLGLKDNICYKGHKVSRGIEIPSRLPVSIQRHRGRPPHRRGCHHHRTYQL